VAAAGGPGTPAPRLSDGNTCCSTPTCPTRRQTRRVPRIEEGLPDTFAKLLCRMSRPLPASWRGGGRRTAPDRGRGARLRLQMRLVRSSASCDIGTASLRAHADMASPHPPLEALRTPKRGHTRRVRGRMGAAPMAGRFASPKAHPNSPTAELGARVGTRLLASASSGNNLTGSMRAAAWSARWTAPLPWYGEMKREQGAFATLLAPGVRLPTPRAGALAPPWPSADSCLVLSPRRRSGPSSLPLKKRRSSATSRACSAPAPAGGRRRVRSGSCPRRSSLLMTDRPGAVVTPMAMIVAWKINPPAGRADAAFTPGWSAARPRRGA